MDAPRVSCAVNLDLSRGWHAASARIEWFEAAAGERGADARLQLNGWIDRGALDRLEPTLDELSRRGVRRLQLDCSRVRHVEFGSVRLLTSMVFRCAPDGLRLRGLSPHLRDLVRPQTSSNLHQAAGGICTVSGKLPVAVIPAFGIRLGIGVPFNGNLIG